MHRPRSTRYLVRRGDSLSRIALFAYGDASVWPSIATANGLPMPYLILVGMVLRLPDLSRFGQDDRPVRPASLHADAPPRPLSDRMACQSINKKQRVDAHIGNAMAEDRAADTFAGQALAREVRYPALKFKLEDWIKPIIHNSTNADIIIKFKGDVTLQREGTLTEIEFSAPRIGGAKVDSVSIKGPNGEVEFKGSGAVVGKINASYQTKLFEFRNGVEPSWDPATGEVRLKCGFSLASKVNGKVFATTDVKFIPPRTYECTYKPCPVKGRSGNYEFEGNVGFVMEITLKDNDHKQQVRTFVYAGAAALVVVAGVIIVADISKDIVFPPGAAESPLSWAAAMALLARAGVMLGPQAMMLAH